MRSSLTKENIKLIRLFAKKESISLNDALNTLIELGFEHSFTQKINENKGAEDKDHDNETKKVSYKKEHLNASPVSLNNPKSRFISMITLITSMLGILLGVIYVLYTKQ